MPSLNHHNFLMAAPGCMPIDGEDENICSDWPLEYIFAFDRPVASFTIERVGLQGEAGSPFVHPAWWAEAIDKAQRVVAMVGEEMIISEGLTERRFLTMTAPRIRQVRICSMGNDASVPSVLIDSFSLIVETSALCDADVNCDGSVDGLDILVIELAVGGDTGEFCLENADFNGDGSIDGRDVGSVESVVGGMPCP